MIHNDMIYEFLNLDVKYSHRIVSLKPSISYDTINICKDKKILGYTSGSLKHPFSSLIVLLLYRCMKAER